MLLNAEFRAKATTFRSVHFLRISALIILISCTGIVAAKRIYQYTDENGIVHLSDKRPETDQPVKSRAMKVDPKSPVVIYRDASNNNLPERFENKLHGPIELEIKFTEQENILSEPPLPKRFVLEPRFIGNLISLKPQDESKGYRLQISYRSVPGDPKAIHDPNAVYIPPIPARQKYWVSQGFNAVSYTHLTLPTIAGV